MSEAPLFYSVAQVARILGVSTMMIYRQIQCDAFPAVKIGHRYVIPAKAIQKMIDDATDHGTVIDLN